MKHRILFLMFFSAYVKISNAYGDEHLAREFIENLDNRTALMKTIEVREKWKYASHITDKHEKMMLEATKQIAKFEKENVYDTLLVFENTWFTDPDLTRKYVKHSSIGASILPTREYMTLQRAINDMKYNLATATICHYKNKTLCNLGQKGIRNIIKNSEDPKELKYTWKKWHNTVGRVAKEPFLDYVKSTNKAAMMNGYTDAIDGWTHDYESHNIDEIMNVLMGQIRVLYLQLHAYVRKQLFDEYESDVISETGPIPAHLLDDIFNENWSNLESLTIPYPPKENVSKTMQLQGYSVHRIFRKADEFYQSLNFKPAPDSFWKHSILKRPNDSRILTCYPPSNWDFYNGVDYRVLQCTDVDEDNLEMAHVQMGHLHYSMQYKHQPYIYKSGANPAFHDAVAEAMALSATSSKYYVKIGLANPKPKDPETDINFLYRKALQKLPHLAYAFMLDQYRMSIFKGEISPDEYNCKYWQLRQDIEGIEPPSDRNEEDFDPGAKFHMIGDNGYFGFFLADIIQFQIHRGLCILAGEYRPDDESSRLMDCDINGNEKAGEVLKHVLKLGSSLPWQDALEMITGQRYIDSSALLEYFAPLYDWLVVENDGTGQAIGWDDSNVEFCSIYSKEG